MKVQPAIKSYFFEKGYLDLQETIKDSWANNVASANSFFSKAETDEWFSKIVFLAAGIAVILFGTAFFVIISLLHVTILFLFFLLIYTAYSIVWSIDSLYRFKNKIFTACPNAGCYKKSTLPVYHCPKCNAEHDQLWPGKYGILKRRCKCGTLLPTTFFNGRSNLGASCPKCKNPIEAFEARPIVIPIIGAPSVGKTFFVFSMVYQIREILSKKGGFEFTFMNSFNESIYNAQMSTLNANQALPKTTENNPIALNFFLEKNGKKSLFFFYDSAGEAFSNSANLFEHKFYDYLHGIIFVIDPFSISDVFDKYQSKLKLDSTIRNSNFPLEDVYDASIINLEKNYGYKATEKITKPVAIIFSKVDAFDLEEQIGKSAAMQSMALDPKIKSIDEAIDKLCRQFLIDNGMEFLLRKFETKFPNSFFFTVSSKGKDSVRIDTVANYLFNKIDKKIAF